VFKYTIPLAGEGQGQAPATGKGEHGLQLTLTGALSPEEGRTPDEGGGQPR